MTRQSNDFAVKKIDFWIYIFFILLLQRSFPIARILFLIFFYRKCWENLNHCAPHVNATRKSRLLACCICLGVKQQRRYVASSWVSRLT